MQNLLSRLPRAGAGLGAIITWVFFAGVIRVDPGPPTTFLPFSLLAIQASGGTDLGLGGDWFAPPAPFSLLGGAHPGLIAGGLLLQQQQQQQQQQQAQALQQLQLQQAAAAAAAAAAAMAGYQQQAAMGRMPGLVLPPGAMGVAANPQSRVLLAKQLTNYDIRSGRQGAIEDDWGRTNKETIRPISLRQDCASPACRRAPHPSGRGL